MNFLKQYANAFSDYVTNVIEEPTEPQATQESDQPPSEPLSEEAAANVTVPEDVTRIEDKGLFHWIPKLNPLSEDNPVINYVNSLASLGSTSKSELPSDQSVGDPTERVVTEDLPSFPPPMVPSSTTQPDTATEVEEDSDPAFMDWVSGISSRTERVWEQVKQDLGEVVSAISTDPKDVVSRTASSVRKHLSTVADAARNIDPDQFNLLPEKPDAGTTEDTEGSPESSEPPSLATLRSDVKHLLSGFMTTLFGSDEQTANMPIRDRRKARLEILRADPATYEREPPSHPGVHSYADWRAAYFDETTCQPLPGIPLYTSRADSASDIDTTLEHLVAPDHPSPEELLDTHPFMRTYMSQLVRMDGQADDTGISDADFWSRYYYRVWLLDVTEQRRHRLAERVVVSRPSVVAEGQTGSTDIAGQPEAECGPIDWSDPSDHEAPPDQSNSPEMPSPKVTAPDSEVGSASKGDKRVSKPRKRRGKKRSEGDRHADGHPVGKPLVSQHTAQSEIQAIASKPDSPLPKGHSASMETEEIITSGSSSVIVLSNSDDDVNSKPQTDTKRALSRPEDTTSDINSDDWGELHVGNIEDVEPTPSVRNPADQGEEEGEMDDWDNWS